MNRLRKWWNTLFSKNSKSGTSESKKVAQAPAKWLAYPKQVPVRMIAITRSPIQGQTEEEIIAHISIMTDALSREILLSPLYKDYRILSSLNHPLELPEFDTRFYVHYLMEESAYDLNATYHVCIYDTDEDYLTVVKKHLALYLKKIGHVNNKSPASYEETILSRVLQLSRNMAGGKPLFNGNAKYPYWNCFPAEGRSFREKLFEIRRSNLVSVKK